MEEQDVSGIIQQAAETIANSKYVTALTGAGISVESGIPPFRGPGGLWTKYGEPDNRGYQRFLEDPKGWWEARLRGDNVRPESGSFDTAAPNPGHYALVDLESIGVLKYIITQNVDSLHSVAGSMNVAEIHGNRYKLRCIECCARFPRGSLSLDDLPPRCPECGGIVKTDGVGFGEPIPRDVIDVCYREATRTDCMLILGTSGVVYPAAQLPIIAKQSGAIIIEVNPYDTELTPLCSLALRGQTGELLPMLSAKTREALRSRR